MSRRKKLVNNSCIPQVVIERFARCILPDIIASYQSEEGQRMYRKWLEENGEVDDTLPENSAFTDSITSETDSDEVVSGSKE